MKSDKYGWVNSNPTCAHSYLLPNVLKLLKSKSGDNQIRILDLGCGNGYVASKLADLGHNVIALDASADGIEIAMKHYSKVRFEHFSIYEDLLEKVVGSKVDCVVSLEVIEHLYYPKKLLEQSFNILKPNGFLILSTPYHGYLKSLCTSILNRWDRHFSVHWEGGHIKFFSKRALMDMARVAGFRRFGIYGVGRLPWLWKSMIMIATKT